jgi:hypothetical protein
LLVLILVLLVAADITARVIAQKALADRVQAAVPGASSTSATIHSFPFLVGLAASGHVSEVDARVRDVTVKGLRFDSIRVDMHGVELDRDELLNRRVVLQKIDSGAVRAEVDQAALSDVLGLPVTLEDGRASVTIAGRRVGADLAVRDGRLVVGVAGLSLPVLDLEAPLLPCVGNASIVVGRVLLACDFTEIPRELLTSAQL